MHLAIRCRNGARDPGCFSTAVIPGYTGVSHAVTLGGRQIQVPWNSPILPYYTGASKYQNKIGVLGSREYPRRGYNLSRFPFARSRPTRTFRGVWDRRGIGSSWSRSRGIGSRFGRLFRRRMSTAAAGAARDAQRETLAVA
ncbi:unnamed protein product [Vitrella brassicaformis CCMP3155]|uniref:Uncharacterized protein n=1 Tax=Vitrella brassicaformis (strain CCMP3155) TaxID=1169540 RepID=A0A0G4EV17_VITBC|nr:unnamed protein product [Vitrella brassicaformis CCMP3155]|eukprot:CEM02177.1 unnamed protein product [Vitrella brassicaformis CCMP3155]